MKKYLYELIIFTLIFLFGLVSTCLAQRSSTGQPAVTERLRSDVTSADTFPTTRTSLGTPFNSKEFEKVRVMVRITDSTGDRLDGTTSCTLWPMIWNDICGGFLRDTPSGWLHDSPNTKTSVKDGYSFLWETRHADNLQIMVGSIVGTGKVNIFVEGSNSGNLNR